MSGAGLESEAKVNQRAGLPASPYGSPPIYMPFSAVQSPLQQEPSPFISSAGQAWGWYPFAPLVDAGWARAVFSAMPNAYQEVINYAMPQGVQDMIIPFAVEKVSPVLLLSGPMIVNSVDANPLTGLAFTVTNISTSLLVIQLNALLDSGNYIFQALVSVMG